MGFGEIFEFNTIFRKEISIINKRRAKAKRAKIDLVPAPPDSTGEPGLLPDEEASVVGLALSGGGIRSAAFCLGALQALEEAEVLRKVDYLSTVSGGGYIGCSLSAALEATHGKFPFNAPGLDGKKSSGETPSMQHVRDFSNYLFPNGIRDVLLNAAIYARGLVANVVLVTPFLLICAALTLWLNPKVEDLSLTSAKSSMS